MRVSAYGLKWHECRHLPAKSADFVENVTKGSALCLCFLHAHSIAHHASRSPFQDDRLFILLANSKYNIHELLGASSRIAPMRFTKGKVVRSKRRTLHLSSCSMMKGIFINCRTLII